MSTSGGGIMIHVGKQTDKKPLTYIENLNVLNIPRCTHDTLPHVNYNIPPLSSWWPSDVLNIAQCTYGIPQCTHGIPLMY